MLAVYDPHAGVSRPFESFEILSEVGPRFLLRSWTGTPFSFHYTSARTEREDEIPESVRRAWAFFQETMPTPPRERTGGPESTVALSALPGLDLPPPPLFESLDEPRLKAVFIAGAPGKVSRSIRDAMFSGTGLQAIERDVHLERLLREVSRPYPAATTVAVREHNPQIKAAALRQHTIQRQGLLVDSTGWDYVRVEEAVRRLRKAGYDCYTVFLQRGPSIQEGAAKSRTAYARLFGAANFFGITTEDVPEQTWKSVTSFKLRSIGHKILSRPVENCIGLRWIAGQNGA